MRGVLRRHRRFGRRWAVRVAGWSAARKSALAIGAVYLVASAVAVAFVVHSLRAQTLHDAITSADRALARNLAIHAYINQELKPAVERIGGGADDPTRFDPAWQSSTYAVRRINAHYRHLAGTVEVAGLEYKESAIDARSPENEADADERAFLARAAADPALQTWSGVRTLRGRDYLVVMRRGETIERSCLRCHGDPASAPPGLLDTFGALRSFGRRQGELASVISIRVPLASAHGSADLALRLSSFLLVVLAATVGVLYLLQRRLLTAPLHALAAQARALAQDREVALPARLPPARELRAVTRLFHAAARTVARRDELLARAVQERTRALDEAQQRLATAERLATVGTMASGVAHEINNPLSYVLANLAYLAEELRLPEAEAAPRHELLHAALDAVGGAERVRAVVQGIQSFARARTAAPEGVDVGQELRSALELCRHELEPRALLDVELGGDLAPVRARPHELRQVFLNLLVNAAHALHPRPREANTIAVVARRDGEHVAVEVRDDGVGIAPEVLPRVFDPFFTTRPVGQGMGLGLSICHGIVRRAGGVIEVESRVGRGSTFRVLLPIAGAGSGWLRERRGGGRAGAGSPGGMAAAREAG